MLFELQGFIHKALLANHLYEAEAVEFVTACKNNSLFVTKSALEHNKMMIFSIFLLPKKTQSLEFQRNKHSHPFFLIFFLPLFNTWWVSNRSVSDGSSRIWKIWKRKRSERSLDCYVGNFQLHNWIEKGKSFSPHWKVLTHLCTYGCVYYKSEVERRMTHLAQLLKHLKGKGSQQTVSEKWTSQARILFRLTSDLIFPTLWKK